MTEFSTPNAKGAEEAMIGAVLQDPTLACELKPEWFFDEGLAMLAKSILKMAANSEPIDERSVAIKAGQFMFNTIQRCLDACHSPANWAYWRDILASKLRLRTELEFHVRAIEEIRSLGPTANPTEEQAVLDRQGGEYVACSDHGAESSHEVDAAGAIDKLFDVLERGESPEVIATGLPSLDRIVFPQPGQLLVLAARPSHGKTALAGRIVESVAMEGKPVGFISLEMSSDEIMRRMASGLSGVPYSDFQRPNEVQQIRMADALGRLKRIPLQISDKGGMTLSHVSGLARKWKVRHGIKLLVVDYLGLIQPDNRKQSRYEATTEISGAMKRLARELDVVVLLLAQLNREAAAEDEKPKLHHLRDSGSIEQDADIVLLLHTLDVSGCERTVDVRVEKQRNGPLGIAPMKLFGPTMRFESRSAVETDNK